MIVSEFTAAGINLDDYADRLQNLGPALDKVGVYVEGLAKQAIVRGTSIGGKPLAPLAASTKANKQRLGKGRGILRSDGQLLASITSVRTRATEVQVGTNLEYAPWVILGTPPYSIKPKKAPALRFYTASGWRRAKEVNHPGLPERDIFEGWQQKAGPFIQATLAAYLSGDT